MSYRKVLKQYKMANGQISGIYCLGGNVAGINNYNV